MAETLWCVVTYIPSPLLVPNAETPFNPVQVMRIALEGIKRRDEKTIDRYSSLMGRYSKELQRRAVSRPHDPAGPLGKFLSCNTYERCTTPFTTVQSLIKVFVIRFSHVARLQHLTRKQALAQQPADKLNRGLTTKFSRCSRCNI